jgi:hypothetical protein
MFCFTTIMPPDYYNILGILELSQICHTEPGPSLSLEVLVAMKAHIDEVFGPLIASGRMPASSGPWGSLIPHQARLLSDYKRHHVKLRVLTHQNQWHPFVPYLLEEYILYIRAILLESDGTIDDI